MKTYRVVLSSLGNVHVEADSVVESSDKLTFYRGRFECGEYLRAIVKSYEEVQVAPLPFPVAEREDSQSP